MKIQNNEQGWKKAGPGSPLSVGATLHTNNKTHFKIINTLKTLDIVYV